MAQPHEGDMNNTTHTLARLARGAQDEIATDILNLVGKETFSGDKASLDAGLDHLCGLLAARLGEGAIERHPGGKYGDAVTVFFDGSASGHVALVGHYDTVWPTGSLAGWGPQEYVDSNGRLRLTGPGIFDMKTGLAQGIWALKLVRDAGIPTPAVTFVLNGDEELGSPASRPVIEQVGSRADATLVLEASVDGAVKTGRKGIGIFEVVATGIQSHAGLDHELGASAIHALAEFITAATAAADHEKGTTVNAGIVSGGSGVNVVAGSATAGFDIRVETAAEQERIDAAFDAITVSDPRVSIKVDHGWNRPPMTLTPASAPLLETARAVAAELGQDLHNVSVGGASDANFVAALGKPVLCGLGAVGFGAHARGEFVYADSIAPQTALLAGMIARLAGTADV